MATDEIEKALKEKYGGLSATKLKGLVIKFRNYKRQPNHTMKHLKRYEKNVKRA